MNWYVWQWEPGGVIKIRRLDEWPWRSPSDYPYQWSSQSTWPWAVDTARGWRQHDRASWTEVA